MRNVIHGGMVTYETGRSGEDLALETFISFFAWPITDYSATGHRFDRPPLGMRGLSMEDRNNIHLLTGALGTTTGMYSQELQQGPLGGPQTTFNFPPTYSFPPFFTPQPNTTTRHSQLQKWSSLIQAWCRHHRIFKLSLVEAADTPLFHNVALRKRITLAEARNIVDWMTKMEAGEGGPRAEWVDGPNSKTKAAAWIWWKRPEEWAEVILDWVCLRFHEPSLLCLLTGIDFLEN